ncbi:hypothetical protein ILUMI_23900 [Ignelater luminosus]|uniref:Hexosyltransferase n=1 Tax=Ignelater luminosus TaxID=2038154 RepID=A0A8K0CEI8_IGNLU|nr:hypothetical protein ILUMI_23900 [Ignelater luminosus]
MAFLRVIKRTFVNNQYLILGVVLGIFISYYFTEPSSSSPSCKQNSVRLTDNILKKNNNLTSISDNDINKMHTISTKQLKTRRLPSVKKDSDKFVRPRYYSTELGIREKLFVGVLTSEDKINTQAIYINKTITHVVDKVKFFITVRNKMKSTFNLTGIVGFTDTRHKYRPFQVIKYIGDTFLQDYDYYFLMNDYNHLNVRKLKEIVEKISVSVDVYLGTIAEDSSFCSLDAGILLSNSVVQAMKANLDWCINNAVSDDNSENLGRCVHHSINLECQEEIQGQSVPSYKLKHFQLEKYLEKLTRRKDFNNAVTIYPILQARDFYLLNAYFSRQRLEKLKAEINTLSKNLNDSWPPGQKTGAKPATRFDLPPQLYFNMTHMFFPDDLTNIRKHTAADYKDIQKIVETIKNKVLHENNNFQYRRLVNGYRTFDLSRGMDYIMDIGFRDLSTGKEVIKRFEVCKPLGKVEFIPAPYVTESTRVTILLPIQETEIDFALDFMNNYHKAIMEHREKALLMLVFLYQYNSSSKGASDVFTSPKQLAVKLSNKYRNEEIKTIWVSIRLPNNEKPVTLEEHKVLNVALVDLALKKIGLETVTLVLDVHSDISVEFLNRVRMNTIANFQIFSPIPFRQYNPKVTQINTLEVNKNAGHFDRQNYKYVSFYGKDYISARKRAQHEIPIIRTDNDIVQIIHNKNSGNIFELFMKHSDNLHCMRATEKELKIKYYEETNNDEQENLFFGTKAQLAKLLLNNQDKMNFIF